MKNFGSFVPGHDENIHHRQMRNFEHQGYGMNSQDKPKNKLWEDRQKLLNKMPPPKRVFIDVNGKVEKQPKVTNHQQLVPAV